MSSGPVIAAPAGRRTSPAVLVLPLLVVGWTADTANWVPDLPSLWPQAVASLLVGYLIATRIRHRVSSHAAGLGVASAVAGGFGLWLPGTPMLGMAVLLVWLTWMVGWLTAWLAYRTGQAQWAFVPGLIVLLVMLANLPPSLYVRLAIFIAAAGASVAVFRDPSSKTGQTPGMGLATAGLVMGVIVSVAAWFAPTPSEPLFPEPMEAAASRWNDFWRNTNHIFQDVPNRREIPRLRLTEVLPMTSPLESGDDLMMVVEASEPRRWRLGTYETYTADGWRNKPESAFSPDPTGGTVSPAPVLHAAREVRISVRTAAVMNQIATAGIPAEASVESVRALSPQSEFLLNQGDAQDTYLPPDLEAIRADVLAGPTSPSASDLLAAAGAEVAGETRDFLVVRRTDGAPVPLLALEFTERLIPPWTYESVGTVVTASPLQLATAATEYPRHVTDRYLQLPVGFPESVRAAAAEITSDAATPYEQAVVLQSHLLTLPYSLDVQAPPRGRDAVEWFLFENQTGFCTYYASAMITMLRSLGVPARLAVGFAPGTFDGDRGGWVVEARHYHAWPEVYFPGFGWVEFEPTPPALQNSLALVDSPEAEREEREAVEGTGEEPCFVDGIPCEELEEEEEDLPVGDLEIEPLGEQAIWRGGLASMSVLSLTGAVALMAGWHLRRIGIAGRIRLRLRVLLRLAGARRVPFETPREMARRLAVYQPQGEADLMVMASAASVVSYSRSRRLSGEQQAQLRTAARSWPGMALSIWLQRWRGAAVRWVRRRSRGAATVRGG
ncbi:MAG: transglutaminaseTgpA domain-containing protein [Chloroflexi bacterium]|nr:transglutaminaseTgpA domain-containing protein [Chloroflexota bacterium]